jgi:hypothetical protein
MKIYLSVYRIVFISAMFCLAISFYSVHGPPYLAIGIFGLVLVAMIPIFFIRCVHCGVKIFDIKYLTISRKNKNLEECPSCHKNPFSKQMP